MILTVILSFQWAVASTFYLQRCKTVSAHEDVRDSGRCSWWLKIFRSFSAVVNMLLGRAGTPDTSSVEVNIRTCRSRRDEELNTQFPLEEKKKMFDLWYHERSSPVLYWFSSDEYLLWKLYTRVKQQPCYLHRLEMHHLNRLRVRSWKRKCKTRKRSRLILGALMNA